MLLNRNPVVRVVNQYLVQVNNLRIIKVLLIAVIWITIFTRGSLVLAQKTEDFHFVGHVDKECTINTHTEGRLQVSFSGGDTTSLVADDARGILATIQLTCNDNQRGTYAIITSPEFVSGPPNSGINNDISTGITTLYIHTETPGIDPPVNPPITPLVSVVGSGKQGTAVTSTPILLRSRQGDLTFTDTWFFIGMEVLFNKQILPYGSYIFKTSLTLLPK
jgi:hypothetical protein